MYIFFFWPFRVFGFILTIYFLSSLGEKLNLKFDDLGVMGAIVMAFSIPIIALFWIDFPKIYVKLFAPDLKTSKKNRKNIRKKIQNNPLLDLFKGIGDLFNFFFGWAVPFVILFILITIIASIT